MRTHEYRTTVTWTGNSGTGTASYRSYGRDHELRAPDHPPVPGSADPAFLGDPARYSPEELLVGALSSCHMLWYLHLCASAGVVVVAYTDHARGEMVEHRNGAGEFERVLLQPQVKVAPPADLELARELHRTAHGLCFIARSVNFAVICRPELELSSGPPG